MKRLLITGSTGLLGQFLMKDKRLQKTYSLFGFGSLGMDVLDYKQVYKRFKEIKPDVVLHLAAYTDVLKAQKELDKCWAVNVVGTKNVTEVSTIFQSKLIYMSTEYVFNGEQGDYKETDPVRPINNYSVSKCMGENVVKDYEKSVIIRTLFKPRPFKHKQIPTDMYTSGGYVDEIGSEIVTALLLVNKLPRIIHIGFEKRRLFDIAKETVVNPIPIVRDSLPVKLPRDTSLNTNLWKGIKYDSGVKTNDR